MTLTCPPTQNRETNFNKVFNANPRVGVLSPFASATQPGGAAPMLGSACKQQSFSASASALALDGGQQPQQVRACARKHLLRPPARRGGVRATLPAALQIRGPVPRRPRVTAHAREPLAPAL